MLKRLPLALSIVALSGMAMADPLPSWNEGTSKSRLVDFVELVTDPDSDDYVTPEDRIAVFDNDGTLWAEQPMYFQVMFALDAVQAMARQDPSILTSDTLRAAAEGDLAKVLEGGQEALLEIVEVTHSGMSVDTFIAEVQLWLETATHPDTGLDFDQMTYQPMVELLRYLRDEGFETYIVSGGGIHVIRSFSQEAYGIPPENVIGTLTKSEYQMIDGVPMVMKTPGIAFINDKAGKPVGIDRHIGKRPILAGGNSDGDFEMLEWTTAGDGPRLGMIVHHTDGVREYAYDRDSHIGKLARGLDEGPGMGWLIVDMAQDWSRIYTGQP